MSEKTSPNHEIPQMTAAEAIDTIIKELTHLQARETELKHRVLHLSAALEMIEGGLHPNPSITTAGMALLAQNALVWLLDREARGE